MASHPAVVYFVSRNAAIVNPTEDCLRNMLGYSNGSLLLGKGGEHNTTTSDEHDDCTTSTTSSSLTSSSFWTTHDELPQDDACSTQQQYRKSVHFELDENQVQILEIDWKERAVMWYTEGEKEMQRQEERRAIQVLQDNADSFSPDGSVLAAAAPHRRAEAIANHRYNTTTRGLEHWVCFQESSKRKDIVRLWVLCKQQHHIPELREAVKGREEEIACASRFALDYSTRLALKRAQEDADYVDENVR